MIENQDDENEDENNMKKDGAETDSTSLAAIYVEQGQA